MLSTQSSVVAKAVTKYFTVFPEFIAREPLGFCVFWKETHKGSLALAQVVICCACHFLSNSFILLTEPNFFKWWISAICCQVVKLRKQWRDGQK